jgi:hypothetical protein
MKQFSRLLQQWIKPLTHLRINTASLHYWIAIWIFILGLYFIIQTTNPYSVIEGFNNNANHTSGMDDDKFLNLIPKNVNTGLDEKCPNILIQKGNEFYLYNSRKANVPGVNPIKFNNLEEYTEFVEWGRSQGIRCPVLYLQETYDTQGNPVLKARPSPTNLQGGVPDIMVGDKYYPPDTQLFDGGHRMDSEYNKNSYPGFDPLNQYVGLNTPLDEMEHENNTSVPSANPMDDNWGGKEYTQKLVDNGYYAENEVRILVP